MPYCLTPYFFPINVFCVVYFLVPLLSVFLQVSLSTSFAMLVLNMLLMGV